jgi:hypothetical protein
MSPKTTQADVISVDELTHKLIADAKALGIKLEEIDEEVDASTAPSSRPSFESGTPERLAKGANRSAN